MVFYCIGNKTAGNYTEYTEATKLWPCVAGCCEQKTECNVAFIFNEVCYHVQCINNELCLPLKRSTNITTKLRLVLVNPVTEGNFVPIQNLYKIIRLM